MADSIEETFIKIISMEKGFSIMLMVKCIMGISVKIKKKAMGVFISMRILNILETLETVIWMGRAFSIKKRKKLREFGELGSSFKNLMKKIKCKWIIHNLVSIILVMLAIVLLIKIKGLKIMTLIMKIKRISFQMNQLILIMIRNRVIKNKMIN